MVRSRITRDFGGVDKSALAKIIFVFILSLFGLICFSSFLRVCDDNGHSFSDCKYVYFGGDMGGGDGVPAVVYTCLYAFMLIACGFGIVAVGTKKPIASKIFAVTLVLIFACISICYYVTMATVGSVVDGSAKDFFLVQVILMWVAEVGLVANTAWDTWDLTDEREMDVKVHLEEIAKIQSSMESAKVKNSGENPKNESSEKGVDI